MAKSKQVFFCSACGNETPRWQGQCSACGAWNTIVEQPAAPKKQGAARTYDAELGASHKPVRLKELDTETELRFFTGMDELDRVLGGGAVRGSLVLVGGAPGIGKSTLLLQICSRLCDFGKVLYVSGEESERQIKLRADRLNVSSDALYLHCETDMGTVLQSVAELKPEFLIVDSIQTVFDESQDAAPGSVSQVKSCTMTLMHVAKNYGVTVFVIGHVNKDGAIAGPKVLEHMVDCVLYFEGDPHSSYRILRAAKNRFGATNEIGVFEMENDGLREISNPSEMLLSGRPEDASGTCVTCVMEGVRPVLAEVQALVAPSSYATPRRTCNGFDFSRGAML
ncbi:MAG: DNA repair protein RadA, partial [Oscillospiraceae bacterium]|nr:DNA repair protein RadA [Oscillospiraceae bacterium]